MCERMNACTRERVTALSQWESTQRAHVLCRAQAPKHVCQLHVVVCFGTNRACGYDVALHTATCERLHETLCQISAEADFFFPDVTSNTHYGLISEWISFLIPLSK